MRLIDEDQSVALLVDDSPESLGFLTTALQDTGITVLVARSGQAALRIAQEVTPDVILMDAVMPGMDGFETSRQLKTLSALAHVPIIFMTGLTATEHIVHALESGGVDYLCKPINIDELRARIRVHLINARRAQRAQIALDATGRHLIALSRNGLSLWQTPQASRLLMGQAENAPYLAQIATKFSDWLAASPDHPPVSTGFVVSPAGLPELKCSFLGLIGREEYLFRITPAHTGSEEDILRDRLGLTPRESEVLLWISRGKANKDIGEILGLSPRTVNKHLEQIFSKIGVENRATAAVKAVEALRATDL